MDESNGPLTNRNLDPGQRESPPSFSGRVRSDPYDVVVAGVGGMGSAACFHLARRGARVLGLERFDVPNTMGSSHGVTRIIRLAYAEGSAYVPLLRRAYELWRELEATADERLLMTTGYVDVGAALAEPALASCRDHDIPHEIMDGRELSTRHPGFDLPPDAPALLQADGGILLPERCIVAHVAAAQAAGAEIHARERVLEWEESSAGVRIRTDRGVYEAGRLVVTAGAWAAEVGRLRSDLVLAERQVLAWFQPRDPALYRPERFPCFGIVDPDGMHYGFPVYGIPGVKVGRYHHRSEVVDPDAFEREPGAEDEALLRRFVARALPEAAGPTMALATCLFELSPDEHFFLDRHPEHPSVILAAGFSGHGFKFASVVGEVVADLVLDDATRHEIGFLGFGRLAGRLPGHSTRLAAHGA